MTGAQPQRKIVLRDPNVDLCHTWKRRGGILKRGLGYMESNVSALFTMSKRRSFR